MSRSADIIHIVIDIRDLRIAKTGAKTYLEEICREFKKGKLGFHFYFADTWLPVYKSNHALMKIIEHLRFFTWKQLILPLICWTKRADILYCSDYFLPLIKLNFKTAVAFHDAFFWEYPEQYNFIWLGLLNSIGMRAAKKAEAIVTMSQYSKQQIIKYVDIPAEKIHVIHLAPKSLTDKIPPEHTIPGSGKKYILHVGVLEKRKNLPNLVKAFHLLLQEGGYDDYYLVLAGNSVAKGKIDDTGTILELIKASGLEERVILTGFISDAQLAAYYRHATVYAFVSVNEGFGIPVLEAFQNHTPVLVANNSCLPEVAGDAALTCNPFDPENIKSQLQKIIDSCSLQNELIEKGYKRLALFSWPKTCGELLNVFTAINSTK